MITAFLFWIAVLVLIFIISIFTDKPEEKHDGGQLESTNKESTVSSGLDVSIDWKNTDPKDYEGNKPNVFLEDEIGQFNPDSVNWKLRTHPFSIGDGTTTKVLIQDKLDPIQTNDSFMSFAKNHNKKKWTEFKERNPELFHPKKPEDCILFHVADGIVIDGTLLIESTDSKVEHLTLIGNIPPNSDKPYRIYGTIPHGEIIHVTEYHLIQTTQHTQCRNVDF